MFYSDTKCDTNTIVTNVTLVQHNWATCDQLSPKAFKKEPEKLFSYIQTWIRSDKTYVVRFAIGMLMQHFLEEKRLDVWVHKKAIQKSVESYRITDEQKTYLKTLKIRKGRSQQLTTEVKT